MHILAQACGRPVEDLRPEMDLRYDLALRSSRFPLIVQDVEKALGISVNFEDLLQVSTVGDLARVLSGGVHAPGDKGNAAAEAANATASQCAEPLRRYAPLATLPPAESDETFCLEPLALDLRAKGLNLQPGDVLVLCVLDTVLLPRLLSGIAPLGCVLGVPQHLFEQCQPLVRAGAKLVPMDINPAEWAAAMPQNQGNSLAASQVRAAVAGFAQAQGRVDGLLFVPPAPAGIMSVASEADGSSAEAAEAAETAQAETTERARPTGIGQVGASQATA